MAGAKANHDVPEKEKRHFRCKVTCYWNGTLFIGEDRTKVQGGRPSEITFEGPTKIPANFQWDNWEEF
jgi:hypothetical protein